MAIESVHRIEVSFDREVSGDALAAVAGVISVKRIGDKWQLTAESQNAVVCALVAFSERNHVAIVTLNTLAPSLDDAFLRLTQGAST
jgi:ABC-2 type transport system ATP-binding protein